MTFLVRHWHSISNSRIARFLTDIRSKVDNKETHVLIEDLGPEETLHGINPLPIDSPLLLVGTVDVGRDRDGSRWEGRVVREEIATPNDTSQGNITEQIRPEESASFAAEPVGLGIRNDRVYTDRFQVVVNLSNRTLTGAENSLLSKGLSFCPTPAGIDAYTLKKEVLEFVRRIRLKE